MLCMKASSVTVLPDGELTTKNETNKPTVSTLKGVGLNIAVILFEVLHLLQDGVIVEMRADEHPTLEVISEQRINNKQMALQRNVAIVAKAEATNQSKKIMQVMEEALRMVP